MTSTTKPAIFRLADVHPHHVERIKTAVDANAVGSVVTYTGKGENSFFTGITTGSRVVIADVSPWGSVSVVLASRPGAALVIHASHVATDIERLPLVDWTPDDIEAARLVIARHENDLLISARAAAESANDADAIAALLASSEAHHLAFALHVWLTYTDGR